MGWNHQPVKFGVHILYGPFVTTPLYQTPSLSVSQIRPSAVTTNLREPPDARNSIGSCVERKHAEGTTDGPERFVLIAG